MAKIFISYRRDDASAPAGRLYDHLEARYGCDQVFMDVDTIDPGADFVEAVEQAVSSCDVLVAVIGLNWLNAADTQGRRRLDDPEDIVRLELQQALEQNLRVIPVLVENAEMPRANELPEVIASLARRNGMELAHRRFKRDVKTLIEALDQILQSDDVAEPPSVDAESVNNASAEPAPAQHIPNQATDTGSPNRALDQLPADISIETQGGVSTVLLGEGSKLPAETSQVFSTAEDNQSVVTIHALLGSNKTASLNTSLLTYDITGIDLAPQGVPQIKVQFRIDIDGMLKVTASDSVRDQEWAAREVSLLDFDVPPVSDPHPSTESGFGDIFGSLFDKWQRDKDEPDSQTKEADIRQSIELSMEEAVLGHTITVDAPRSVRCTLCNHSGRLPCTQCNGSGQAGIKQGFFTVKQTCPTCHGKKVIQCGTCAGFGGSIQSKQLSVTIPSGVDTGDQIRLADEGHAGDLYLEIKIREHEIFSRKATNLYVRLPVSGRHASRGGKVRVPAIGPARFVLMALPANTRDGATFRLKKKGAKDIRTEQTGDLIVTVEVYSEENSTEEQAELKNKIHEYVGQDIEL